MRSSTLRSSITWSTPSPRSRSPVPGNLRQPSRQVSHRARPRCWPSSPRACRTPRSRPAWWSAKGPSRATSTTCSPRSAHATVPRRWRSPTSTGSPRWATRPGALLARPAEPAGCLTIRGRMCNICAHARNGTHSGERPSRFRREQGSGGMTEVDTSALRDRYAAERDKRLRPDGNDQYLEFKGRFEPMLADPYTPRAERAPKRDHVTVAIVGGGFAGLLTGARLKEAGIEDVRIVEKGGGFGGTWYWNRYPGAQCDTAAMIYMP